MEPYEPIIKEWLIEDKTRHYKQRHTAKRVYDRLSEMYEVFNVSYPTVATTFRRLKSEVYYVSKEYAPLRHLPGEAQVDFVKCLGEKITKRIENELFLRFKNHYDFRVEYCRSKAPNQKGHVEGKIGYLRRNLFVPMPVIDNIDEYNRELLMRCMILHNRKHHRTKQSIIEMFNSCDVQALLEMPAKDFEVATILERKVDREGRVRFNGQRYYYLEPSYAKKKVQVKLTYNKVLFYDMTNNLIAEFDRLYGDKKFTAIHWEKWLPTISRKPNSLFHSSLTDMFTEQLREFLLNGNAKIRGIYMKALCELINSMSLSRAMGVVDVAARLQLEEYDAILQIAAV